VPAESEQPYERLSADAGYLAASGWSVIKLTGDDRSKFLQSFCTADITAMVAGQVREAFVLNGKGKTIGHLNVLNLPDCLMLVGPGEQAAGLMQHLDMYIIRDDVQLEDRSAATSSFLIAGRRSSERIAGLFDTSPAQGTCQTVTLDGTAAELAHAEFAGECYWLGVPTERAAEVGQRLQAAGCGRVPAATFDMLRLQQGTPWFGHETTPDNLPQELNRDDKTISFTKGCYLGQETVARIDSLGRVNKLLVVLKFAGAEPTVGQELKQDGKTIGRLTSVAAVPGQAGWRALAFVKRELAQPGSQVGGGVVEALTNRGDA